MSAPLTRKLLQKLGLLEKARSIKRAFNPPEAPFMPCTPHLLIAINKSLRWCQEQGLAEGGDYLEFGCFRGFSLWYTQALMTDMGIKDMRCFGFDSFAGLPEPTGLDAVGEQEAFYEGAFYTRRNDVEKHLSLLNTNWDKTFLVEGWYDKTLTPETRKKYGLRRCAICVIDCDLYESTRLALSFAESLLADQSIILFDDWHAYKSDPAKGEQRAFQEFLDRNPHFSAQPFVDFHNHGKGFILKDSRRK